MKQQSEAQQLKHLEFLQAVITRMATNSFLVKGWAITLTSALFALSAHQADRRFAVLSIFPALVFWILDAYYLSLERRFRKKYEDAARGTGMSLYEQTKDVSLPSALCTVTTSAVYGSVVVVAGLIGLRVIAFGN